MSPKHAISDALDLLAVRLDPILQAKFDHLLDGLPWYSILAALDQDKGIPPKKYSQKDVQAQLRMLFQKLGNLGYPFDDKAHTASKLANSIKIIRNQWAHGDELDWQDAWELHDCAERLLAHLGDQDGAAAMLGLAGGAAKAAQGVAPGPVPVAERPSTQDEVARRTAPVVDEAPEEAHVAPDPEVLEPENREPQSVIVRERGSFEAWPVVLAGPTSVIEDLPKKAPKMRVRAVASEIVAFEGPVAVDRLVRLTARAFGWSKLHKPRFRQILNQVKQADGVVLDQYGFAWDPSLDREVWRGFRPASADAPRAFLEVSEYELANVARYLVARHGELQYGDLRRRVLQTFGRSKGNKQVDEHLQRALLLGAARGFYQLVGDSFRTCGD